MDFRVGIGYDAHRFEEGRDLILGGVKIPYPKGLFGHSDADALCHAVSDAILGAAALGDLGRHFRDSDPQWAGADSMKLLQECARMAMAKGWDVVNVDTVVVCQKPQLLPYLDVMAKNLAKALALDAGSVSVKAKTTEKMGFEGREEGISAHAVAMLQRS